MLCELAHCLQDSYDMRPRLRAAPPYPSTLTAAVPRRTHYVLQYCELRESGQLPGGCTGEHNVEEPDSPSATSLLANSLIVVLLRATASW